MSVESTDLHLVQVYNKTEKKVKQYAILGLNHFPSPTITTSRHLCQVCGSMEKKEEKKKAKAVLIKIVNV